MTADTAQSSTASAPSVAAIPQVDPPKPIPLDAWCRDLSTSLGRKVELLSAFHSLEKRGGRLMDLAASYAQRFEEFKSAKPISSAK
jgi:hypothetical protein